MFGSQREQVCQEQPAQLSGISMVLFFIVTNRPGFDEIPVKTRHLHGAPRDWPCSGKDSPRSYVERFLFKGRNVGVEMVGVGEVGCWVFKIFKTSK